MTAVGREDGVARTWRAVDEVDGTGGGRQRRWIKSMEGSRNISNSTEGRKSAQRRTYWSNPRCVGSVVAYSMNSIADCRRR